MSEGSRTKDCATRSTPRSSTCRSISRSRSVTGGRLEPLGGHVHPLVAADRAGAHALGAARRSPSIPIDRELHGAVREQDAVADPEIAREPRVRGRGPGRVAGSAGPDLEPLTGPERERIGVARRRGEPSARGGRRGRRERAPGHSLHLAHDRDAARVIVRRAVRAVDPEDRGARLDEPSHHLGVALAGPSVQTSFVRAFMARGRGDGPASATARASSSPRSGAEVGLGERRGDLAARAPLRLLDERLGELVGEVVERAGHLREARASTRAGRRAPTGSRRRRSRPSDRRRLGARARAAPARTRGRRAW